MKQTGSIIGFTLLLTALTPAAFAADRTYSGDYNGNFSGSGSGYNFNHDGYDDDHYNRGGYNSYVYAKVIESHPVYETVRRTRPQRECYDEPVRSYNNNNSYTGIITGGILGGVLGNQVGSGRGQDIATIAGTILGGSVGRDLTRGNNYGSSGYRQRCDVVDHHYEERRPAGYHVTYWYNGRVYETRTDYRPGEKIRIQAPHR